MSTRGRAKDLNRGFTRILVISLFVHVSVLGGAVYAQIKKGPTHVINSIPVQLVKLGKPRDPNLLPRIVNTAPPPPPPDESIALDTNKAKPPPPKKDEPTKEPKLSDAAKRLLESKPDLDRPFTKPEDEEGSPDGSAYGTTTDATNAASGYVAKVGDILQQAYSLPKTIAQSERRFLSAEVVLYIERDGTISKYEFQKIHPNEAFRRALELVLKQVKLPPPPPELANEYRNNGLGVRFIPGG